MEDNNANKKTILRDKLFQKFFENNNGNSLSDIYEYTKYITDVFDGLKLIMLSESGTFDNFMSVEMVRLIKYNNHNLLFIKVSIGHYYIFDIQLKKVLNDDYKGLFDIDFFVENFHERKNEFEYETFYQFDEYNGNIDILLNYFICNRDALELDNTLIKYIVMEQDAKVILFYDIKTGNCQIDFATADQFLYEQLYLKKGLVPSSMQDAERKIGKSKMLEMFQMISNIKIPFEIFDINNIIKLKKK